MKVRKSGGRAIVVRVFVCMCLSTTHTQQEKNWFSSTVIFTNATCDFWTIAASGNIRYTEDGFDHLYIVPLLVIDGFGKRNRWILLHIEFQLLIILFAVYINLVE